MPKSKPPLLRMVTILVDPRLNLIYAANPQVDTSIPTQKKQAIPLYHQYVPRVLLKSAVPILP